MTARVIVGAWVGADSTIRIEVGAMRTVASGVILHGWVELFEAEKEGPVQAFGFHVTRDRALDVARTFERMAQALQELAQ